MIGVFVFSETKFDGITDRIHLFENEQDALDWQIKTLIHFGFVSETWDNKYVVQPEHADDGDPQECETKLEVLEEFQDMLGGLEFFHAYIIQSHIAR